MDGIQGSGWGAGYGLLPLLPLLPGMEENTSCTSIYSRFPSWHTDNYPAIGGESLFGQMRIRTQTAYREGQEDQFGSQGLVLNMLILWNTIYMDAALQQLCQEGYSVLEEDVVKQSPLQCGHINMQERYTFTVPESVSKGGLRVFNKE